MNKGKPKGLLAGELLERVIYRAVTGSRAYGLAEEGSDTDWRGFFLPTAEQHWSLVKPPEQIELDETQEVYWEIERFLKLALKLNPTVLECLYSPQVETATPLAQELLQIRGGFLSCEVHRTFGKYAASQFQRIERKIKTGAPVKHKHSMHLLRLLMAGAELLETGNVRLDMSTHREELLRVKHGELPWPEVDQWRLELQARLDDGPAEDHTPGEERSSRRRRLPEAGAAAHPRGGVAVNGSCRDKRHY